MVKVIGDHVLGANEGDGDAAALLLLARVVIGEIHMLGCRSVHRIVGHSDASFAVAEQVSMGHTNWVSPRSPLLSFSHFSASLAALTAAQYTIILAMVGAGGDVYVAVQLRVPRNGQPSKKKVQASVLFMHMI